MRSAQIAGRDGIGMEQGFSRDEIFEQALRIRDGIIIHHLQYLARHIFFQCNIHFDKLGGSQFFSQSTQCILRNQVYYMFAGKTLARVEHI